MRINPQFPAAASLCAALLAAALPASAALVPLDSEFHPPARLTRNFGDMACHAGDGLRVQIEQVCPADAPGCSFPRLVAHWSRDGAAIGEPIDMGEMYYYSPASVSCSKRGTAIVASPYLVQTISPDGPLGPATCGSTGPISAGNPCGDSGHTVAATADGFFVAWRTYLGGQLLGRFLHEDGSADGDPLPIADYGNEGPIVLDYPAAIAAGPDRVVVAWLRHRYATYEYDVLAVLVDRSGVVSEEVTLNQSGVGSFQILRLHGDGAGRYIATWLSEFPVGRRFADEENMPTTTTTTTTLDARAVEFLPSQRLAGIADGGFEPALAASESGRWFADWYDAAGTSTDDGRRWTESPVRAGVATDDQGRWIRVNEGQPMVASISDDDGQTWDKLIPIYENDLEATWHGFRSLRVAAGADGRWVVAWYEWAQLEHDGEDGDYREDVLCGVRMATSPDRGETWTPARTVLETECYGEVGSLSLATDRAGGWVLAWDGSELRVMHSVDNAATWSAPSVADLGPASLFPAYVDVAADGAGTWLMTYQAATHVENETAQSTIFLSRSTDAGTSWSEPSYFVPWHDEGRGYDSAPSVDCEGGRCGVAWMSASGTGGGGIDADILASFSTDAGASWSAPKLVDRAARDDDFQDYTPNLVATDRETWGVLWWGRLYGGGGEARFARSRGHCGDGNLEPTEECDDGNTTDGDGCDETCLLTGCGNGIATAGEQCDDGNADEQDECISNCEAATCGDGFVHAFVEPCDDGNSIETDDCRSGCIPAMCGDSILRTGVEECDTGDARGDGDACLRDCRVARCGDGFIHKGVEECDDDNLVNGDRCTKRCRIDPYCADAPSTGGGLTATHALSVLKKAVGMRVRCPVRRCDMNGDVKVTAVDALEALRASVGAVTAPACEDRTLVIRLKSTGVLGALQIRLDYDAAEGDIARTDGSPACEMLAPNTLYAMNLDAGVGTFVAGVISLDGFSGPLDVARCNYRGRPGTGTEKMTLTLEDATDVNGEPRLVEIAVELD